MLQQNPQTLKLLDSKGGILGHYRLVFNVLNTAPTDICQETVVLAVLYPNNFKEMLVEISIRAANQIGFE